MGIAEEREDKKGKGPGEKRGKQSDKNDIPDLKISPEGGGKRVEEVQTSLKGNGSKKLVVTEVVFIASIVVLQACRCGCSYDQTTWRNLTYHITWQL